MNRIVLWICLLFFTLISCPALGQELIIYPGKGQSKDQVEKDKFACYQWAKDQTGFDPMAVQTTSTPPPEKKAPEGGLAKGAVRGALVGLAAGSITGDAGKGAAIGAASGGLIGGMKRADQSAQQQKAEQDWAQKQVNEYTQKRNTYNRAYSACLESRGYTVK